VLGAVWLSLSSPDAGAMHLQTAGSLIDPSNGGVPLVNAGLRLGPNPAFLARQCTVL
jgi:hypothetical protein